MPMVRDRFWLWGQTPDGHYGPDNPYRLPGHSRMTAMEGNAYFGIPNCCRVKIQGQPAAPYDQESMVMDTLDQVVWSLLGAGGEQATEWGDLDEVIRQARLFPNITGGIFDDFFSPHRMDVYTPEKLSLMKKRLCEGAGRDMSLWVVYYERELGLDVTPYFAPFDVITFWTWYADHLADLEKNLDAVIAMAPGKRVLAGCYMWDYGGRKPMTCAQMER
ncbi:MAG: hypothetical protein VB070_03840 [Clostridiaceae bacterium]|nr:hypothetical protein [Clostridiaceae bacterium]